MRNAILTRWTAPNSPDELTPAWITRALRSAGIVREASISRIELSPITEDSGTTARLVRVALAYESDEAGAPSSLIAKFPRGPEFDVAHRFRLYEREAGFYEGIAPLPDLRTPRLLSAANNGQGDTVLLLEDMAPARVGDVVAGCGVPTLVPIVEALAKTHARFWGNAVLCSLAWLPRPNATHTVSFAMENYEQAWRTFSRRGGQLPPEANAAGDRLRGDRSVLDRLSQDPCTLTHGDLRLNNLAFDSTGNLKAVIDWQSVTFARGPLDLASLLVSNLDPEDCERAEAELLPRYTSLLRDCGVENYGLEQCWTDYRLGVLAHFTSVVMLSALVDLGGDHNETVVAIVGRPLAAVTRLNLHDLLPGRRGRTKLVSRLRSVLWGA